MNNEHDAFARALAARLERASEAIVAPTRSRLRAMRRRATASLSVKRAVWLRSGPLVACASAAVVVLAIVFWPQPMQPVTQPPVAGSSATPSVDPALEWNSDADPIAFEEDLEFYLWLEQRLEDS